MSRIDDVIITVPTMTEAKRAIWSTNTTRITRIKPGKIIAQLRGGE